MVTKATTQKVVAKRAQRPLLLYDVERPEMLVSLLPQLSPSTHPLHGASAKPPVLVRLEDFGGTANEIAYRREVVSRYPVGLGLG